MDLNNLLLPLLKSCAKIISRSLIISAQWPHIVSVHIQNSPIQNSPIQNSPKPVEFHDLDLLAPTELIYALKTQTEAIKDQRAKFGTIIRMKSKGLMV